MTATIPSRGLLIMLTSTVPVPDAEFYLSFVDFEVGQSLFRLPKYHFEQSSFFQYLFSGPSDWFGTSPRYTLTDTTDEEFRYFLRFLLYLPHQSTTSTFSASAWLSIMRLTTIWGFDALRADVIAHIRRHEDSALRLAVGTQYGVKDLLPGALDDLVDRDRPLDVTDHELLGSQTFVNVVTYREKCRRHGGKIRDTFRHVERIRHGYLESVFGPTFAKEVRDAEKATHSALSRA
ncbi:hypothetical protein C8Q80DRAFT_244973 [Daedaleopsis nitida]|nr:hypothetical protein C8Q80DRAFT_244973 [Daedaleopsis nitida]